MAKLSKTLLKSLFLTAVAAQEGAAAAEETAPAAEAEASQEAAAEAEAAPAEPAVTFAVTSCNDESSSERPPALSFKIAKLYFDNNLSDQADSFTLNADGDFYERTIAQSDLSLSFDTESDDILLSYSQAITSSGFALTDTSSVSFAEDELVFSCRYSRSVSATSDMTVTSQDGEITGNGDLTYSMTIDAGVVGGNSVITISPNHNISGVGARLTSCNVSSGDHQVYPIHSFRDETVCFDNSRLNVIQTLFGESVAFSMRTFRFTAGDAVDNEQQQTIDCNLHLEPIADITQDQAADCTCHTQDQCTNPVFGDWSEWSECSVTCGDGTRTQTRECTAGCSNIDSDNADHSLTQTEACTPAACPAEFGSFGDWGACSVSCGGGTQTRTAQCEAYCTDASPQTETQDCNAQACNSPCAEFSTNSEVVSKIFQTDLTTPARDGDIALCQTDSDNYRMGIPMVKKNGQWGTVCDDSFGDFDAQSFCYNLFGRTDSSFQTGVTQNHWTEDEIPFLMDNVECPSGNNHFVNCPYGEENCGHTENIIITCSAYCGQHTLQSEIAATINTNGHSSLGLCQVDGATRKGILMTKQDGVWGSVCDDSFTDTNAQAACRTLGYSGGSWTTIDQNKYGWQELTSRPNGGIPFWRDNVACDSPTQDFMTCDYGEENCNHSENILLTCS